MRFFFYGTLMAGSDNPMARLVEAALHPLGPARARGVLHAVPDPRGWYPALLPGEGMVEGRLYEGNLAAADLARLDRYEDYDPVGPEASLYLRRPMIVTPSDEEPCLAEAYLFNQPLPEGARPILGGDFQAWLVEHGLRPFAP